MLVVTVQLVVVPWLAGLVQLTVPPAEGLAVPVTMYEYDPRRSGVGVMLRLNNLVIGSDNMLPLLTRGNLYGVDAYVRLKWTIFRSPVCRGKKKAAHRPGDGNALPCVLPE